MATTELAPPVVNSAQQLEPGVVEAIVGEGDGMQQDAELLSRQYGGLYPPSNVAFEILPLDQFPNPKPPRVLFAGLRDPRLRMVRAIPLEVTREESTVVVCWSEINEFGTGETLSSALDDFASGLSELYQRLFAPDVNLGPDLRKVRETVEQYIQPRK